MAPISADRDGAEYLCARSDHDAVADGGVAFFLLQTDPAQGHAVIQGDVVSDFRCLADHQAHAVIDENAAADFCGRVNLDTGQHPPDLGNKAADEFQIGVPGPVGHPVKQQGVQSRITEQYLGAGPCRRILFHDDADIFADPPESRTRSSHAKAPSLIEVHPT